MAKRLRSTQEDLPAEFLAEKITLLQAVHHRALDFRQMQFGPLRPQAANASDRVGLNISEYIAQGDWRLFFKYRDAIETVTLEDVVTAANTYFKPSNRTIGIFIPEEKPDRTEIPNAPELASLLDGYKGKALIAQGEEFDPSFENIQKRTTFGKEVSGMEIALLPKENRGDAVNGNISMRFGTPNTLVGKSQIARMTSSMLDKGTKKMTRQQIQDKLDAIKAPSDAEIVDAAAAEEGIAAEEVMEDMPIEGGTDEGANSSEEVADEAEVDDVSDETPAAEAKPEGLILKSAEELARHFRLNYADKAVRESKEAVVTGNIPGRLLSSGLLSHLRQESDRLRRGFPLDLIQTLCRDLEKKGLKFFKRGKKSLHVYAVRPKELDPAVNLTEQIQQKFQFGSKFYLYL